MNHWRSSIIALATALALCGGVRVAHADENKAAAAQPADKAEAAKPMEGCMPDGSCCGACQGQQTQELAAKDAGGGCPCQKAKQAAQQKAKE